MIFLLVLVVLIGVLIAFNYHSGIPVEKLIPKYTTPESEFLLFGGMKVHYRVTGKGPTLVLLHGVASGLHTWNSWQNRLSNDFTVISLDLPGFSLTGPNPNNDYSVIMYMKLLDALFDKLQIDSCFMAGNSFGGFLTWNYAIFNPVRVKKLILIDAAGFLARPEKGNLGFMLAMNPFTKWITYRITPKSIVKKSVEDVYGDKDKVKSKRVQTYYDLNLRKGNREALSQILINLRDMNDQLSSINRISQPTLIMWGDKDKVILLENAEKFRQAISDSRLIIYPGVGHIPMEEIPGTTANDARIFLIDK